MNKQYVYENWSTLLLLRQAHLYLNHIVLSLLRSTATDRAFKYTQFIKKCNTYIFIHNLNNFYAKHFKLAV